MRHFWGRLLLLLMVLAAVACAAQDYDDDDDEGANFRTAATLSLGFDKQGAVSVNLDVPQNPKSWDGLRGALAQALHCPADRLSNPTPADSFTATPNKWSAAQRERYQKQIARFNQRRLAGKCDSALARNASVLQGDMDFAPFAAELARNGAEELALYINVPQSTYFEYSHTNLVREPQWRSTFLMYRLPLGAGAQTALIHLAYGFRPADLRRSLGILAGFILLPFLAVLWMRRAAMIAGKDDPTAAWFGFFRTFNLLLTGAMLLWITSGLGARQALQDWISQLGLPVWESAAARTLILLGPGFLVYLMCIAVSYPVHEQLRGSRLSRREFLLQQTVTVGAQAVPLMLGLAALEMLKQELEVAVGLLIVAVLVLQVFQYLKLRVTGLFPQALTTGELRDRVVALAGRFGVKVLHVFVLPAGKGQVANAYAAKNKIVMFTDYLLEHLSKREVDAIAAHELAHLHHKHPTKRAVAFGAAIFLPSYFSWLSGMVMGLIAMPLGLLSANAGGANLAVKFYSGMAAFEQWSQHDFVLIMLGLTGFYFLSRRFENVADATAVRLVGDPEAQITGLLKVNRLNRTPIQWGKASESWLTHPSTVRRAERIAAAGGMAPERLQEILGRFVEESRAGHASVVPAEDRYVVPGTGDQERVRAALSDRASQQVKLWALRAVFVFPPALFALLIRRTDWLSAYPGAAYLAGLVITGVLVTLAGVWLGEAGHTRERRRLLQRFEREGIPAGRAGDVLVGFAPSPYPRLYGSHYHWDGGFLILAQDRLQFVGEQTRFSLSPEQIDGITLGRGGPSWWKFERIYVRWKDAANQREGVFNLYLLEPGSMWTRRSQVRALCSRLQAWRARSGEQPAARPEFSDLQSPKIGEVTCLSPKAVGKLNINLKILGVLLPFAIGVAVLFHVSVGYLCWTVIILRVFQSIPYWRYRDTPPAFDAGTSPPFKASAARASSGTAQ